MDSCTLLQIAPEDHGPPPRVPRDPAHLFAVEEGRVTVRRADLEAFGRIAARSVERESEMRDHHGRVPSEANALVASGLEHRPVVSEAGHALRDAVRRAAGRLLFRATAPWPRGARWVAALTHDLDVVSFWPLFTALRIAELARQREWSRARRVLDSLATALRTDPILAAVRAILETEARAGARSTWFVLSGVPTLSSFVAGDLTYRVNGTRTRKLLSLVVASGGEIGLHGSMATLDHDAAFADQRATLVRLTGARVSGVRQHFLRMRDDTLRRMRDAGFDFDSTLGFADRAGFRTGVADVLPAVWNGSAALPELAEAPFCWMDRSQSKYQKREDPEALVDSALSIADSCRGVDGLWNGIWHPNLTAPLGFPDTATIYERIVRGLAERGAGFVTLTEAVEWRRAASAIRVRAVAADGTPILENGSRTDVPLEDERGQWRGIARASNGVIAGAGR